MVNFACGGEVKRNVSSRWNDRWFACWYALTVLWMAFDALKHRDVAQINRVLEWLIGLMTGLAFSITEAAKIHRVPKPCDLYRSCGIL